MHIRWGGRGGDAEEGNASFVACSIWLSSGCLPVYSNHPNAADLLGHLLLHHWESPVLLFFASLLAYPWFSQTHSPALDPALLAVLSLSFLQGCSFDQASCVSAAVVMGASTSFHCCHQAGTLSAGLQVCLGQPHCTHTDTSVTDLVTYTLVPPIFWIPHHPDYTKAEFQMVSLIPSPFTHTQLSLVSVTSSAPAVSPFSWSSLNQLPSFHLPSRGAGL